MPILSGLDIVQVKVGSSTTRTTSNHTRKYSSCSYGFVAEKGRYRFNPSDLHDAGEVAFDKRFTNSKVPMVLKWTILNEDRACASNHSERVNEGVGYLCKCSKGYAGNPYTADQGGCTSKLNY
ncbi:hypothetical protein PR202_ga21989 [Eleusine coracana subsp. coracana]|uniref:Uncharacterized protein n=1 Tax=Eleusine coracana subsp. coracana TaxID=191504 RepID=A0AAV5D0G9_ELECO|nr:hypothetical protein PR202_ga21989 [Eleusine coracana subsp. coracana]